MHVKREKRSLQKLEVKKSEKNNLHARTLLIAVTVAGTIWITIWTWNGYRIFASTRLWTFCKKICFGCIVYSISYL